MDGVRCSLALILFSRTTSCERHDAYKEKALRLAVCTGVPCPANCEGSFSLHTFTPQLREPSYVVGSSVVSCVVPCVVPRAGLRKRSAVHLRRRRLLSVVSWSSHMVIYESGEKVEEPCGGMRAIHVFGEGIAGQWSVVEAFETSVKHVLHR